MGWVLAADEVRMSWAGLLGPMVLMTAFTAILSRKLDQATTNLDARLYVVTNQRTDQPELTEEARRAFWEAAVPSFRASMIIWRCAALLAPIAILIAAAVGDDGPQLAHRPYFGATGVLNIAALVTLIVGSLRGSKAAKPHLQ